MSSRQIAPVCLISLALGSGCGWMDKAAAKDTIAVVFAPDGATTVTVDGGAPVEITDKHYKSFPVGPGTHSFEFDGGRKLEVAFEPFDRLVVPSIDDQCFMSINVSQSHYSADGEQRLGGPDIAKRIQSSEPFKLPSGNYLSESELPKERGSGDLLMLLRSLPCAEIDRLESGLAGAATQFPGEHAAVNMEVLANSDACTKAEGPARPWCAAAAGWSSATSTAASTTSKMVGISLELPDTLDLQQPLVLPETALSVLALVPADGGMKAHVDGVKGENEDEQAMLVRAVGTVSAALMGERDDIPLDAALNGYIDSIDTLADKPLRPTANGWSFASGAELRRVGEHWVAVEDSPAGVRISLYTEGRVIEAAQAD